MNVPREDKGKTKETGQKRSWRLLGVVLLFLLAMNAGFAIAVYVMEPQRVRVDLDRAEKFMKAIELGNDVSEEGDISGYEIAYDMLQPAFQSETDFAQFLYFFDDQVRAFGFIQSWRRLDRERGHFSDRRIRFEVEYGGTDDSSSYVVYELTMSENHGDYSIARYAKISTTKKAR